MLPKATLKRVMKEIARKYPDERPAVTVSSEAVDEVDKLLEKYLIDIIVRARTHALRCGRKTIKKEDINAAIEKREYIDELIKIYHPEFFGGVRDEDISN